MKKNVFLLIGLFVALIAQAQVPDSTIVSVVEKPITESKESSVDVLQNYIYFSPLYLIVEGTRLDFEHRFQDNSSAINLGLTFYVGDMNSDLFPEAWGDEEYTGIKADFLHKIYLEEELPIRGKLTPQAYISHGPFYQYSNIKYPGQEWQEVNSNGLDVLTVVDVDKNININRFGYTAVLGLQVVTESRLTVDVYTGLSIRKAWATDNERSYDETWLSPGHTGNVLLVGFKIGAAF